MNFSEQIINVLDYLGSKMGIAIDWTNSNVLPYIEQLCGKYITWEISTSIIWIVLNVLFIITVLTFGLKFAKKVYEDMDDELGVFLYIAMYGIVAVFFICVIVQIFDITKCVCFPEMRIYEYITSLMSNNS